jgi:hypothetical protein
MIKSLTRLPPALVVRAAYYWWCGRIHFPKNRLGEVFQGKEDFIVFRQVVLDPDPTQPERPGAILAVRFQFRRFSLKTNRILSIIPIPFILAQPGFRSKIWMFGKRTGEFQGLYEWGTVDDAEKYRFSFPMKLMKKRAIPESLTYEIKEMGRRDSAQYFATTVTKQTKTTRGDSQMT